MPEYWSDPKWAYRGSECLLSLGADGGHVECYIYSSPLVVSFKPPRTTSDKLTVPIAVLARMATMAGEELCRVLGEKHGAAAALPAEKDALRAQLAAERQLRLELLSRMTWNPTEILVERNRAQRESETLRETIKALREHLVGYAATEPDPHEQIVIQELIDLADAAVGEETKRTTAEDGAGSVTASEPAPSKPPTNGSEFP